MSATSLRPLLVLLVLITSCRSAPDHSDVLLQAPDRAREAGSARMSVLTHMRIAQVDGDLNITSRSEGTIDFDSARSRIKIDARQEGPGALSLKPCELVTDGATAFLQIPEPHRARYDGKTWLQLDMGGQEGIDPNLFATDPTASLEYIRGAGEDVEEVGTADVRGVPTTHYRFRVDRERLLDRIPAERRDALAAHLEQMQVEEIPYEAWLDREDVPARRRSG